MIGGSHVHPDKYLGVAGADRPLFFLFFVFGCYTEPPVAAVVVVHLQFAVAAERQEAKRRLLSRRRDLRHHDSPRVEHLEPRPVKPCRCHRPVCCWGELPVGVARIPDVDVGGDLVVVKLQGVEWRGHRVSHGRDEVRRQSAVLAAQEFVRWIVGALPHRAVLGVDEDEIAGLAIQVQSLRADVSLLEVSEENKY